MQDWYRIGDILLMTSEWEGIPLVLYEAMAMQVPCIAPNVGGISEIVNEDTGLLVHESRDIEAYVEAILKLEQDHELRERLGRQARSLITHEFSLERLGQKYIQLYSELLESDRVEATQQDRAR
jgi:glycosyltransferase involved in cell wall biosynthesis